MKIILENISKKFSNTLVINNFNYSFEKKTYAITGKNGSGKSTLLKIIGNLLLPSSGIIKYDFLENRDIPKKIFFSAPYQELISELTIKDFLNFHKKFRDPSLNIEKCLNDFNLIKYYNKKIENLSSGTIQKLKLLISFHSNSEFILLDEPTTNLDHEGKLIYKNQFIKYQKEVGIIIATNDDEDIINNDIEIIKLKD